MNEIDFFPAFLLVILFGSAACGGFMAFMICLCNFFNKFGKTIEKIEQLSEEKKPQSEDCGDVHDKTLT